MRLLQVLLILCVFESHLASPPPACQDKPYLRKEVIIDAELKWDPAAQELCSLVPISSLRNAPHSDCSLI